MELGNGFSCTAAQVCPAQNLTTNVISGARQLYYVVVAEKLRGFSSSVLGWLDYACNLTKWELTTWNIYRSNNS
jgi:hypothetical protein